MQESSPDYALEPMSAEHRTAVMAIFNHYTQNSFASFFETPLPEAFFDRWLEAIGGRPAYVARDASGRVAGFGFLRGLHAAPTLARSAEVVYFLDPAHTRRGLGGQLLEALIGAARGRGIDRVLASISGRNAASLAFHRSHGFVECGRWPAVGRKFGQDFDVVWMVRVI